MPTKQQTYHNIFLILLVISSFSSVYGQIEVSDTISNSALKTIEYLTGEGVDIINPNIVCPKRSLGTYIADPSLLEIEEGVVLTTGNITDITQSATINASSGMEAEGDDDLEIILANETQDACMIEFDLIPVGDTISFNYIFASEEYPLLVCTEFNDVFGFFISGPGISGPYTKNSKNIALIPNTNTAVSINTLNGGTPGIGQTDSICNSIDPNWQDYSTYYIDNSNSDHIVFNGRTVSLTAEIDVTPCDTYHLKLAIADGLDDQYDSGVFLEKGSISSNKVRVESIGSTEIMKDLVEGCFPVSLYFERKIKNQVTEEITRFNISGSATRGADYLGLPDSIVLAPDQIDTTITLTAPEDYIDETNETIIITLKNDIVCSNRNIDSIIINVRDSADAVFPFNLTQRTRCDGDSIQAINLSDSLLDISWTGDTNINCINCLDALFYPEEDTKLYLSMTSPNNCIYTDSFNLNVSESWPIDFINDTATCIGDTIFGSHSIPEDSIDEFTWISQPSIININAINSGLAINSNNNQFILNILKDGCITTDTLNVTGFNAPEFDTLSQTRVCSSTLTQLIIPNCGDSCIWTPNNFLYDNAGNINNKNDTLYINLNSPFIYNIEGSNYYTFNNLTVQCSTNDSLNILINTMEDIDWNIEEFVNICAGDEIQLSINPKINQIYEWGEHPFEEINQSSNQISLTNEKGSDSTNIELTATDTSFFRKCSQTQHRVVKFEDYPELDLKRLDNVLSGKQYTLSWSGNAQMYEWDRSDLIDQVINDTSFLTTPLLTSNEGESIEILVTAVNEFGTTRCAIEDTITLYLFEKPFSLPLIFTPNNDDKNEAFHTFGIAIDDFNLKIYNRWGNVIYEMTEWGQTWDGNDLNGNPVPAGVYVWVVNGSINGEVIDDPTLKMGEITLIR